MLAYRAKFDCQWYKFNFKFLFAQEIIIIMFALFIYGNLWYTIVNI